MSLDFLPITKSILFGRLSPTRLIERKESEFQFVSYWNKAKKIIDCQSLIENESENTEHRFEDDIIQVLKELRGEYTPFFIIDHIPWCGFPCPNDTTKEVVFYDIITQLETKITIVLIILTC